MRMGVSSKCLPVSRESYEGYVLTIEDSAWMHRETKFRLLEKKRPMNMATMSTAMRASQVRVLQDRTAISTLVSSMSSFNLSTALY